MNRLAIVVWSVLSWSVCFAWMLLVCLYSIPLALVWPFHRWQHKLPSRMLGCIPRFTGSRFSVTYDPRYDPARRSVFVQNHVSVIDGHVALAAIPHPFCGVENRAHFYIPFYGWLMKLGGGIAVPGTPGGRLAGIIDQARERVRERNISILVLPEGGRTLDGRLKPFHRGGFVLARELGLPVVPVVVRGLDRVLPKGRWTVRPGHIEVYVGPHIETRDLDDRQLDTLVRRMRSGLAAWVERREPFPEDLELFVDPTRAFASETLAPSPELAREPLEEEASPQPRITAAPS